MAITPRVLPFPLALCYISGVVRAHVVPTNPPALSTITYTHPLSPLTQAEIAFGAMLMLPGDRMQNLGAWGLVALLFAGTCAPYSHTVPCSLHTIVATTHIAVWPANIYCVFDAKARNAVGMTPALALIRVPLQGVFFAWAYQLTTTSFRGAAASAGINM